MAEAESPTAGARDERPLRAEDEPAIGPGETAQRTPATPEGGAAPTPDPKSKLGIGGWLAIGWLAVVVICALFAPLLPLDDPARGTGTPRSGVGENGFLLGSDGNGRDTLSRTVFGTRVSMLIGVSAVAFGVLVGGTLGLYAGYFRNRLATAIAWLFDVLLAFPALVLALSLVAILASGPDVTITQRNMVLILALGIVSIPLLGRITRANTLSWAQREFVLAARSLGAKDLRIMLREVLPNVMPAMFSIALLGIAVTIVAEGGLAVLGAGTESISWGRLISDGRGDMRNLPHLVFVPSAAIFLTVLALNYLGDVVRSRFDVRESAL